MLQRKTWWMMLFVAGLAACVAGIVLVGTVASRARLTLGYDPAYEAWFAYLRKGVDDRAEMERLLRTLPRPADWVATYVTEYNPARTSSDPPARVGASEPNGLTGRTVAEAQREFVPGPFHYLRQHYYHGDPKKGDLPYALVVVEMVSSAHWAWLAILGAVTAWLSLAAWVYTDARERRSGAAPAWTLLTFLTGPVGVAVWLIARLDVWRSPAAEPCPGCGATVSAEHAFCVRCGHAVRPACPGCRRPVEADWGYCGTCGTELGETEVS